MLQCSQSTHTSRIACLMAAHGPASVVASDVVLQVDATLALLHGCQCAIDRRVLQNDQCLWRLSVTVRISVAMG
jgi:hypothetical protein